MWNIRLGVSRAAVGRFYNLGLQLVEAAKGNWEIPMWLKFSWVLWLPGLRFMFVTPFPLSVPGPDTSLSVCTYGSAHPVEWPLCLLLAVPPRDVSIPTAGCSAPTAHNSVSVCPGRKQLPCGGDEKSRANTFWISASGQINFNLNCHHKGLFFLSLSFGWYLWFIFLNEASDHPLVLSSVSLWIFSCRTQLHSFWLMW